jgi:hypothetical protein
MQMQDLGAVTRWGKVPAWWLLHPEIDADRFAVLAALATYADENGICEPSQATLAKRLGRSRPWVNRVIADLASVGLLRKTGRSRANGGTTSCRYMLALCPSQTEAFARLAACEAVEANASDPVTRQTGEQPFADSETDTPRQRADRNQLFAEQIQNPRAATSVRDWGQSHGPGPGISNLTETLAWQPATEPTATADVTPDMNWVPSETVVAEARRLAPNCDLDLHTSLFISRSIAKGYAYRSLDAAWLSWLLKDRADDLRRSAEATERERHRKTSRPPRRGAPTDLKDRLHAWATAARMTPAPFGH